MILNVIFVDVKDELIFIIINLMIVLVDYGGVEYSHTIIHQSLFITLVCSLSLSQSNQPKINRRSIIDS